MTADVRAPTHGDLTVRSDLRPERFWAPADRGCDWQKYDHRFRSCFTCPLPRCRSEYPPEQRQRLGAELRAAAYERMIAALERGVAARAAAAAATP